jgi:hypothetical protein
MNTSDQQTTGWADRPRNRQRIRNVLYVICGLLVVADFLVHRHTVMPLEKLPAFYTVYGFAALVTVVLLARLLRRLVGRSEDYYEKGDDDAG